MGTVTVVHDLSNENARDLTYTSVDLKDAMLDVTFNTSNFGLGATMSIGYGAKAEGEQRILGLYDVQNAVPPTVVTDSAQDLDGAVVAADLTIDVDSTAPFAVGNYIRVASDSGEDTDEIMLVTAIADPTLTITRGQLGTTAADHNDDRDVYILSGAIITAAVWWLYISANTLTASETHIIAHCRRGDTFADSGETITEDLDTSETRIDASDNFTFLSDGFQFIKVDDEIMFYNGGVSGGSINVVRAQLGTAAATHTSGASIYLRDDWSEGYCTWDRYTKTDAGASTNWSTAGGDPGPPFIGLTPPDPTVDIADTDGTGWWTWSIIRHVHDARFHHDDIINMLFYRNPLDQTEGTVTFGTKDGSATPVPHVRITYTLADKTYQVFVY